MEFALTIIAGLGLLLLIISYLGYIRAGFKYNFVTGVISTLPVLNIVTLPALWNKVGKKFMMGLLGFIIFGASWFLGVDKVVGKLIARFNGKETSSAVQQTITSNSGTTIIKPAPSVPAASAQANAQQGNGTATPLTPASAPFSNTRQRAIDESEMNNLPAKALYIMRFETIPVNQITSLKDRIVRIKTKEGAYEGRLLSVNNNSVVIQSGGEQELAIANIRELQLMTKKAQP